MNVSAKKIGRLLRRNPCAQGWAATVFSRSELVERGIKWRKMYDEMERFDPIKFGESLADFFFGIFSRGIERRDVAVAETGPLRKAGRGFERAHIAMEINESIMLAER